MNRTVEDPSSENGTADAGCLTLRGATMADAGLLWRWANDAEVRRFSFERAPIPWGDHVHWLERKLANPETSIWIAHAAAGTPIGQIRFDGEVGDEATVGLSVACEHRGWGYGSQILRLGVQRWFENARWRAINAWIKPDNLASQQSFVRGGFQFAGEGEIGGHRAFGYRLQRP